MKEEPTTPLSNPSSVVAVMFVSGDVPLTSSLNIEMKRRVFGVFSTEERFRKKFLKIEFPYLLAKRPVPYIRIQEVMSL